MISNRRGLRTFVISAALAYGVGAWMVWLHHLEGGHELHEPPFVWHWLRDSSLALPVVFLAAWAGLTLADRLLARSDVSASATLRRAVITSTVAVAGALAVGVASPLHQLLFEATEGHALSVVGHVFRDTYVALAMALPISALVTWVLVPSKGSSRAIESRAASNGTSPAGGNASGREIVVGATTARSPAMASRRDFLKVGATTVAAAGVAGTGVVTMSSREAAARPRRIDLFINDGDVQMIDGTPMYMLRYSRTEHGANGGLHIPERPYVLRAKADQVVEISVKNNLDKPHGFALRNLRSARNGRVYEVSSGRIQPGETWKATFRAPRAGIYLYEDPVRTAAERRAGLPPEVYRVLGLGGAFLVRPRGREHRQRPFEFGPRFAGQPFTWVLQDTDPVWNELARAGRENEIADPRGTFLPRYFNINGKSGFQAESDSTVHVARKVGEGDRDGDSAWISIVNVGLATHSLHWHGNHVLKWEENGERLFSGVSEDDVVRIVPGGRAGVILPIHRAMDAWPPERGRMNNCFPMHCHAEMSQTAAGGLYPSGMVTHWDLVGDVEGSE